MMSYDHNAWMKKMNQVLAQGPYTDSWESLSEHQTPEWFRKAKLGIFIHWGPYSVPAFGSEWYSRNMYREGTMEFEHHQKTYGLQKDFGYKDFIPMLKAERFDPEAWAELFEEAGAKYVILVAEHHDGFQMYRSELSHWNAYEMGPQRDVLSDLNEALHQHGLITGASSHRIEHWWFMGSGRKPLKNGTPAEEWSDIPSLSKTPDDLYWPSTIMDSEDNDNRYATPAPSEEFLEDWMFRTMELIDHLQPQELYFDWWVFQAAAKPYLRKILAYYYNRGAEWNKEVLVITKNDGIPYGCAVPDMERGGFHTMQAEPWQTDTAVGKISWGYTRDNVYKTSDIILQDLIDTISRNGVMLLNVGPKADGTIPEQDQKLLREIGSWLRQNGEAVYGSRPWRISMEGPTAPKEGAFSDQTDSVYSSEDFRFTVNHGHLYIFAMKYPDPVNGVSEIRVHMLAGKDHPAAYEFGALIRDVEVLGYEEKPEWVQKQDALIIRTKTIHTHSPVVFRVEFL